MGRKLREIATSVDDLKEPALRDFLTKVFERVVMTSTFVERVFKDLTSWTSLQGQEVGLVAANHVNSLFALSGERWRHSLRIPRQSGRERPAWTKHTNQGKN